MTVSGMRVWYIQKVWRADSSKEKIMASSSPIDVRPISPLDLSLGVSAFSAATDTLDGINVIFCLAAVVWPADKAAKEKRNAAAAMDRRPTFIRDPPRSLCLIVFLLASLGQVLSWRS
jgi:hypothetical protein